MHLTSNTVLGLNLCLLGMISCMVSAATLPIVTSRPSVSDTTTTVPPDRLQWEIGTTYTLTQTNKQWTAPETLIRYGIDPSTELRLGLPSYSRASTQTPHLDGFSDSYIGVGYRLRVIEGVDTTLVSLLNLPTGGGGLSHQSVDPQLRLAWSKTVGEALSIGGQLDYLVRSNAASSNTLTPGFMATYGFSPKTAGFLEWAGTFTAYGDSSQIIQIGLTHLLDDTHQIDGRIGLGLTTNAPDLQIGFGYAFATPGNSPRP